MVVVLTHFAEALQLFPWGGVWSAGSAGGGGGVTAGNIGAKLRSMRRIPDSQPSAPTSFSARIPGRGRLWKSSLICRRRAVSSPATNSRLRFPSSRWIFLSSRFSMQRALQLRRFTDVVDGAERAVVVHLQVAADAKLFWHGVIRSAHTTCAFGFRFVERIAACVGSSTWPWLCPCGALARGAVALAGPQEPRSRDPRAKLLPAVLRSQPSRRASGCSQKSASPA